jgi:hypothetical protein
MAVTTIMSYGIPLVSALANKTAISATASMNFLIAVGLAALALIVGFIKDHKRRKMISTIDSMLLSDEALGIKK